MGINFKEMRHSSSIMAYHVFRNRKENDVQNRRQIYLLFSFSGLKDALQI